MYSQNMGRDVATEHDPWMLAEGEYILVVAMYRRGEKDEPESVGRCDSYIQVKSKNEARYYFNVFTDIKRRVRKLERAVNRLF